MNVPPNDANLGIGMRAGTDLPMTVWSAASNQIEGETNTLSGVDRERLARANINPITGLATDYLNHFNEAIMLLEMLSAMPECADDFLAWRPLTYCEHFAASNFKERELAIEAYEVADPAARYQLDELADTMNGILTATRDALELQLSPRAAGTLAAQAAAWLKPMVARAGAVINGTFMPAPIEVEGPAPQATVDALFER
jgi:hypothetical protein